MPIEKKENNKKNKIKACKSKCGNNVKSNLNGVKYCENCGCSLCFQHKWREELFGKKVCQRREGCKEWIRNYASLKTDYEIRQGLKNKQSEKDGELGREIGNISTDFYEKIKKTLKQMADSKSSFIDKDKKYNAIEFLASLKKLIEDCPVLVDSEEKKRWWNLYASVNDAYDMLELFPKEKNFLVSLAQNYKDSQENDNRERERQEQERRERENRLEQEQREREQKRLQIIQDIKTELENFSPVNITEIDSQYHNYESLNLDELEAVKDSIIQAINNKWSEKKLSDLLNRTNNCSESDLWNLIQELEQFISSTTSHERNAFQDRQNEVIAALNKLQQHWDNLSEEQKLTNYWNNAIQNFDNWLKEAENLQLTADDAFSNFKEDIKKFRTVDAIDLRAQSAKKYILIKFQRTVKKQLGTEQVSNEYQEIDRAKDFAGVKKARNNIKQRRTNHTPTPPSPSPNKSPEEKNAPSSDKREYSPDNSAPEKKSNDNKNKDKNIDLPKQFPTPTEIVKLDLAEVKQIIQDRIETLLANLRKKLAPASYKNLCEGKECWKKYLWENLTDKEQVITFGQKIEKIIQGEMNQKSPDNSILHKNNLRVDKTKFFSPLNIFIILACSITPLLFLAKKLLKKPNWHRRKKPKRNHS